MKGQDRTTPAIDVHSGVTVALQLSEMTTAMRMVKAMAMAMAIGARARVRVHVQLREE